MDIQNTRNMNKILYSSYRPHHSKTTKIERTENTFTNQLSESNNYLTIIDEFYHSLKQKKNDKKQLELSHEFPIDDMVNLIVDLVKSYNKHYKDLLNYDHEYNDETHIKLKNVIIRFKFNLNQIGINISQRNLLKISTYELKDHLEQSFTCVDFIFEKNGLIDNLERLYKDHLLEHNITHFDRKG